MKRILCLFCLILIAFPARAEDIVADLSVHAIDVTVNFCGARLLVFGAAKRQTDVVIVIQGPLIWAKLWTKKRKAGLWINDRPMTFDKVPGFYTVLSSKPVEQLTNPETANRYGMSLNSLAQSMKAMNGNDDDINDCQALIQAEKARKRYQEKPSDVRISKGGLFRADVDLPASVPIGEYVANIYLLKDGQIVTSQKMPFDINHAGIEASINNLAHNRPFLYAFLALVLSLSLGGSAAYLFRRVS